jgi:hypothetical protein
MDSEIPEGPASMLRSRVEELDRQVERGSLFTQASLERNFRRLGQAESVLSQLIEALANRGVVSPEELGVSVVNGDEGDAHERPADEPPAEDGAGRGEQGPAGIGWPSIAIRVDDPNDGATEPEVVVDCAARMPVCHAICCQLKFPLTSSEIDRGVVKWDIGHPYIIRQESSGYCTHNDTDTGGCQVYADRPALCRRYSCANDRRIWADFDNMVLNQEWIDGHLGRRDLHVTAALPSMDLPAQG